MAMNVDTIFGSLGSFSVRFRWLMTLAWILAAMAVAFLLGRLNWWPSKLTMDVPESRASEATAVGAGLDGTA
jgi:uncharacterized membrane protein YdfJ with MMPL/SSD domain